MKFTCEYCLHEQDYEKLDTVIPPNTAEITCPNCNSWFRVRVYEVAGQRAALAVEGRRG